MAVWKSGFLSDQTQSSRVALPADLECCLGSADASGMKCCRVGTVVLSRGPTAPGGRPLWGRQAVRAPARRWRRKRPAGLTPRSTAVCRLRDGRGHWEGTRSWNDSWVNPAKSGGRRGQPLAAGLRPLKRWRVWCRAADAERARVCATGRPAHTDLPALRERRREAAAAPLCPEGAGTALCKLLPTDVLVSLCHDFVLSLQNVPQSTEILKKLVTTNEIQSNIYT